MSFTPKLQGMMRYKLEEATFFLGQMKSVRYFPVECDYYFSAFLSAARSVLQYPHEAYKGTADQAGVDALKSGDSILHFFKDSRNINIHREPAKAERTGEAVISDFSPLTQAAMIDYEHERVQGWTGSEDLWDLCEKYLERLGLFIHKGAQQQLW